MKTWNEVVEELQTLVAGKPPIYKERLNFELSEIEKQGAESVFLEVINNESRLKSNPNKLIIPYLYGLIDEDPIEKSEFVVTSTHYDYITNIINTTGALPPEIYRDTDSPDIDLDCLPYARDIIKDFVAKEYGSDIDDGYGTVCSVGTWQTYLFRSALIDAAETLEICTKSEVMAVTVELPDDVDQMKDGGRSICKGKIIDVETKEEKECKTRHIGVKCPKCGSTETEDPTLGQVIRDNELLQKFIAKSPAHGKLIKEAVKLIGKIRHVGKHAGALIITDRPLFGNIPMFKKNDKWISMWTEGRNPQLSKLGYTKWDILGLKNLNYIFECCKLIEKNHGISFGNALCGLEDINPHENRAGVYWLNGEKHNIAFDDEKVLQLANELKTDAIFQFDTELAKSILANGVRSFDDLLIFNAMGHPGPMQCIPEYVEKRDDPKDSWRKNDDPKITNILGATKNVIVWQEDLQAMWQGLAAFTIPEAQAARKAVAKKWKEMLKPIEHKWIVGASKTIGKDAAVEWWSKMVTFGRYAFNKSHGVAYCLTAYRSLWLKAHYAAEWWASAMSYCDDPKKLIRYINVARAENIKLATLDVNNLDINFSTTKKNTVTPGLIGLKNVGKSAAAEFCGKNDCKTLEEFIEAKKKNKIVLERLIKLGAFKKHGYDHVKATWAWYLYKFGGVSTDIGKYTNSQYKKLVNSIALVKSGWTLDKIKEEQTRQAVEYKKIYPKRKVPAKIQNWQPTPVVTYEVFKDILENDYCIDEILEFEKEYLGYYLTSPMHMFSNIRDGRTIANAQENRTEEVIEVVITVVGMTKTKADKPMCRLVITDGIQEAILILWSDDLVVVNKDLLKAGTGVRCMVNYDKKRNNFTLSRGATLMKLKKNPSTRISILEELLSKAPAAIDIDSEAELTDVT